MRARAKSSASYFPSVCRTDSGCLRIGNRASAVSSSRMSALSRTGDALLEPAAFHLAFGIARHENGADVRPDLIRHCARPFLRMQLGRCSHPTLSAPLEKHDRPSVDRAEVILPSPKVGHRLDGGPRNMSPTRGCLTELRWFGRPIGQAEQVTLLLSVLVHDGMGRNVPVGRIENPGIGRPPASRPMAWTRSTREFIRAVIVGVEPVGAEQGLHPDFPAGIAGRAAGHAVQVVLFEDGSVVEALHLDGKRKGHVRRPLLRSGLIGDLLGEESRSTAEGRGSEALRVAASGLDRKDQLAAAARATRTPRPARKDVHRRSFPQT